jgi:PHP family Zn ribbon phosphoesterase
MSWGSGLTLYHEILEILKKHVSDPEARTRCHIELIKAFEAEDCNTLFELLYPDSWEQDEAFREAWRRIKGDPDTED